MSCYFFLLNLALTYTQNRQSIIYTNVCDFVPDKVVGYFTQHNAKKPLANYQNTGSRGTSNSSHSSPLSPGNDLDNLTSLHFITTRPTDPRSKNVRLLGDVTSGWHSLLLQVVTASSPKYCTRIILFLCCKRQFTLPT